MFRYITKEIEGLATFDYNYYTCPVCKEEMKNIVVEGGRFVCCRCDNDCNFHEDILLHSHMKVPKMVKQFLQEYTKIKEEKL